jgi:hypothetical protein
MCQFQIEGYDFLGLVQSENHSAGSGHFTYNIDGAPLPLADVPKYFQVFLVAKQSVVFLVLRTPKLQHVDRGVAQFESIGVYDAPDWLNQLLQDVSVASSSLIVDAHHRIVLPQFQTSSDDSVELLLHLRIPYLTTILHDPFQCTLQTSLHRVEVQFGFVVALDFDGTGRTAPHADSIHRPPDFDDLVSRFRRLFFRHRGLHGPHPSAEHDGFDPLLALTLGVHQTERPHETADQRFAEFVAVVGGSVARLYQNF